MVCFSLRDSLKAKIKSKPHLAAHYTKANLQRAYELIQLVPQLSVQKYKAR